MRVFFAGLWSSVYSWAKAGMLKGPRSRWTRIPRYPEHRQYPLEAWPATRPLEGVKGQGPPEAAGPSNGTRQRARSEDHVKMQRPRTRGTTAVSETKRRGDRALCRE
jgi:hypothetical protein